MSGVHLLFLNQEEKEKLKNYVVKNPLVNDLHTRIVELLTASENYSTTTIAKMLKVDRKHVNNSITYMRKYGYPIPKKFKGSQQDNSQNFQDKVVFKKINTDIIQNTSARSKYILLITDDVSLIKELIND